MEQAQRERTIAHYRRMLHEEQEREERCSLHDTRCAQRSREEARYNQKRARVGLLRAAYDTRGLDAAEAERLAYDVPEEPMWPMALAFIRQCKTELPSNDFR